LKAISDLPVTFSLEILSLSLDRRLLAVFRDLESVQGFILFINVVCDFVLDAHQLPLLLEVSIFIPSLDSSLFLECVESVQHFVPNPLDPKFPLGIVANGVEQFPCLPQSDGLHDMVGP